VIPVTAFLFSLRYDYDKRTDYDRRYETMVTTGAASFNNLRAISMDEMQHSQAEARITGTGSADDETGTMPLPEEDSYIPSAQRLAEESLQNCMIAQSEVKKDDKKSLGEELVKVIVDFIKAPKNIYLHKKSTDAAVEGDFEKSRELEDKKADYNKPRTAPDGKRPVTK
jgi:hypothetical protein